MAVVQSKHSVRTKNKRASRLTNFLLFRFHSTYLLPHYMYLIFK